MNVFIVSKTGIGEIISNHLNKTCDKSAYTLKKIDTGIILEKPKIKNLSLNDLPVTLSDKIDPAKPALLTSDDIEAIEAADKVYLAFDTTPYGQHQAERVIKEVKSDREYLRVWPSAATEKNIQYAIKNAEHNGKYRHLAVYYQLTKNANYLIGMNVSVLFNAIGKIYEQNVKVSISVDKLWVLKVFYEHYEGIKNNKDIKDRLSIYAETKHGKMKWQPDSYALDENGNMVNATLHYEMLRKLTKAKTLQLKEIDTVEEIQAPPKPLTVATLYEKISAYNHNIRFKDIYTSLKKLFYKGYILNPDGTKDAYNIEHKPLGSAFIKTIQQHNHPLAPKTCEPVKGAYKTFKKGEHGALMPIYSSISKSKNLRGLERQVYKVIVKSFIAQYLGEYKCKKTTATYIPDVCSEKFKYTHDETVQSGWVRIKMAQLKPTPPPAKQIGSVIDIQKIGQRRDGADKPLTIADVIEQTKQTATNAPRAIEAMIDQGYLKLERNGRISPTETGLGLLKIIDKAPDYTEMLEAIEKQCKECHTESGIGSSVEYIERKVSAYVVKSFRLLDSDTQGAQRCPECIMGYIVRKSTDKGDFAGCCNYPVCDYAEKSKRA